MTKYFVRLSLLALGIGFFAPQKGLAEILVCFYSDYDGARDDDTDIVISWLGNGFAGDTSKSHVALIYGRKPTQPVDAELIKQRDFTGFVYYAREVGTGGRRVDNRYSFRFYRNGRCEAMLTREGYLPLKATGQMNR